jgi:DNA polymerase
VTDRVCHLDFETYSEANLKTVGAYNYAEHPSTEILIACYAFDDGPVICWTPGNVTPAALRALSARGITYVIGNTCPIELRQHIESGGEVRAHNAQFERVIANGTAGRKVNFPTLRSAQMVCTAAKCRASGLPGDLGEAAAALGTHPKNETGRMAMLQLSKPRKGKETRYTWENALERFVDLCVYCADDVLAERDLDHQLPDLSRRERRVWELDQAINDRGVAVDLVAIDNARALIDEYKLRLAFQCELATGFSPTQRDKIAEWVRTNNYPQLPDLQAETVRQAVHDPHCPIDVADILKLYSTYNAKAVTKYDTIVDAVCSDGRLRGMFLYHGAATGRWASRIVQLQNMFRPVIEDCDTAIEAFAYRDLDWLIDLYPETDPLKVLASCIRGMLVPAPGKVLQSLDYAAIESRVNAWLWGEEWKLQAYRDYDAGMGPDLYCVTYGRAFRVDPRTIGKKDPRRQLGKVQDLAFGYEGGVSALITWADTYSIDLDAMASEVRQVLPPEVMDSGQWMWERFGGASGLSRDTFIACDGVKQLWRRGHPKLTAGWANLKEAAWLAVKNPGNVYSVAQNKVAFQVDGRFLKMRLPSGRCLHYLDPEAGGDEPKYGSLSYMGVDTDTRRWMRTKTYGGKLDENAVQAISRDLLVNGMFELEAGGFESIGSVHDEVISEVDPTRSLDEAQELFCRAPAWAAGLPLASEGWHATRYRK